MKCNSFRGVRCFALVLYCTALLSAPSAPAFDILDPGVPDSMKLRLSDPLNLSVGDSSFAVSFMYKLDSSFLKMAAAQFVWNLDGVRLDSSVVPVAVDSAFNFYLFTSMYNNNVDSSNSLKHCMFAGQLISLPGLTAAPQSQELVTFHFTVEHWTAGNTFVMDTSHALFPNVVYAAAGGTPTTLWYPVWAGALHVQDQGSCCVADVGNVDGDPLDIVSLADFSALVDHLFISLSPLICPAEANCDGSPDGIVGLSDLTALQDHLFITFSPLPTCQ